MSRRLTPETDAERREGLIRGNAVPTHVVPVEFAEELERERDEARAAIPDGEWVAYEDHKKVHEAASRLLVAINKQLPMGSFSLISHEYHALKDAIYGKEGARCPVCSPEQKCWECADDVSREGAK